MELKEWLKNKESIFKKLLENTNFEFIDSTNSDKYDLIFKHLYGNMPVNGKVENYTLNEVITIASEMYFNKWTKQYNLLYNEVVDGVSSETTTTDDRESKVTSNNRRTNTKDVGAFNTEELVTDSKDNEEGNALEETKGANNKTETKKSMWAVTEQMRLHEKPFIENVVMKDLKNLLVRKIY